VVKEYESEWVVVGWSGCGVVYLESIGAMDTCTFDEPFEDLLQIVAPDILAIRRNDLRVHRVVPEQVRRPN